MNKPPRFPWSKPAALKLIFLATLILFVSAKNTLALENTNSANEVEIVMDCTKARYVGPWTTGMAVSKYRFIGGSMPNCYASFRPDLPISGNYEIYEWRSAAAMNRAENARYEISFKGGSKTSWVNQQINGQQWNLLGVFPFDAGTNGEVRIDDANGMMGRMLIADRVAFVLPEIDVLAKVAEATNSENKVEIVMDSEKAKLVGAWASGQAGGSIYSPRYGFKGKGSGASSAAFQPDLPVSGNYEIYEWRFLTGTNRAMDAPYEIRFKGGSKTIPINQQTNGKQWNLLGVFPFEAGTDGEVRVTDAISTQGQIVVVPKVRFVLVAKPEK